MALVVMPPASLKVTSRTTTAVTVTWTQPSPPSAKPGQSFVDSSGVTWALSSSGSVQRGGVFLAGGGGTAQIVLFGTVIWGQDAATGKWYVLNQTNNTWSLQSGSPLPTKITWQAQYRKSGTTAWTLFPGSVSVQSVTIGGLAPATSYDVEIIASGN